MNKFYFLVHTFDEKGNDKDNLWLTTEAEDKTEAMSKLIAYMDTTLYASVTYTEELFKKIYGENHAFELQSL